MTEEGQYNWELCNVEHTIEGGKCLYINDQEYSLLSLVLRDPSSYP